MKQKLALISALSLCIILVGWFFFANKQNVKAKTPTNQDISATSTANSSEKRIALTFDDGPYGTSTQQILDILKQEHVQATFFVIGKNVEEFPDEVRQMLRNGHVVGNHSYDHAKNLDKLSAQDFQTNLDKAEAIIASSTGLHATLFRPPYGTLSKTMRDVLQKNGYIIKLWNVDPEDWNYEKSPSDQIVHRVLDAVKPGSIILMHDGRDTHVNYPRDNTVKALPMLIEALKAKGYTFITVDKL